MSKISKTLLITCACSLATSYAQLPVAWYKFDEGSGATTAANAIAGSSTGAVGSSVVTGVAGISGNAYQFPDLATQAGIVDMGNASFFSGSMGLNSSTEVTYSLWMNTTTVVGNRSAILYSGSDTVANSYQDIGVSGHNDNTVTTGISVGSAYSRNRPPGAAVAQQTGIGSNPTLINDGSWHHLVMTVNLTTQQMRLYVDGALANTQTFTTTIFPTFNNFEIGRLGRIGGSGPTDAYGGLVDEVQVYNYALSDSQVSWLYSHPMSAVPEPGEVSVAVAAGLCLLIALRRKRQRTA